MKKFFILFLSVFVFAYGCKQKTEDVESKKKRLSELKSQIQALKEQSTALEKEIALMGGGKTTELKLANVMTSDLQLQPFKHYIEVQGKVDTDNNVQVSPEMGGSIVKINVKSGDKVQKGQVLAELDGSMISTGIAEVKTQLETAKVMYEKQKRLWDQKVGSEVQFISAKTQKEALENRLASMQTQYSKTRIKAPIAGTVDEVRFNEGEMAAPGMPMFRVVNLSGFKVVAEIAENYQGRINKGDSVLIEFPDLQKTVKAKVTDKSNVISALNRTFSVEANISDRSIDLSPNMVAKVKINDYVKKSAVVVPINLIQYSEDEKFVFVAEPKDKGFVARKRIVKTGIPYGNNIEILEGLNAGDKVITVGYQDLNEGQPVKF